MPFPFLNDLELSRPVQLIYSPPSRLAELPIFRERKVPPSPPCQPLRFRLDLRSSPHPVLVDHIAQELPQNRVFAIDRLRSRGILTLCPPELHIFEHVRALDLRHVIKARKEGEKVPFDG